jgi:hypothetical protein
MTVYRFRIAAANDAGQGDFSEIQEFSTCIAPPPSLKGISFVQDCYHKSPPLSPLLKTYSVQFTLLKTMLLLLERGTDRYVG